MQHVSLCIRFKVCHQLLHVRYYTVQKTQGEHANSTQKDALPTLEQKKLLAVRHQC